MTISYSRYIRDYVIRESPPGFPIPGEHHFVSAYLVPKLLRIRKVIPDYISPDGTKHVFGDVVYFRDGKHHFGIEVKLRAIRLTAREFHFWIVNSSSKQHPNLFIGVGNT